MNTRPSRNSNVPSNPVIPSVKWAFCPPIQIKPRKAPSLPEGAVENSPGQVRCGGRSPGIAAPTNLMSPVGSTEFPAVHFRRSEVCFSPVEPPAFADLPGAPEPVLSLSKHLDFETWGTLAAGQGPRNEEVLR